MGRNRGVWTSCLLEFILAWNLYFLCSESLEIDLPFVWKSRKGTGTVGIVLSLRLVVLVFVWRAWEQNPPLPEVLGIGTHYCLLLSTFGTSIHFALENPRNSFSFVLIAAKPYITMLCASCLFGSTLVHSDLAWTIAQQGFHLYRTFCCITLAFLSVLVPFWFTHNKA
jgi:hypothetical protein